MPARTVENLLTMDSTCVSGPNGQLDDNIRLALQFSMMALRGNDEPGPGPASSNAQELGLYRKRSPNVTECVRVPSSEHVAEIVGRQGCKIKALRARTNTYIKTPVRGEEPVFVITGRKEDVGRSKYEILLAAEHFTQLRAKRHAGQAQPEAAPASTSQPAPASICPSTSSSPAAVVTPFTSLIAPSSVHAALAQFASIPGNVTVKLAVPVKIVGLIVGPKGATIKRIQQETKTYILTPSRDKDAVFEITGAPEGVERAKQEIEQHVQARTGCTVPELLDQQAAMLGSARPSLTGSCADSNSSSSSANSSVSDSLLFGGANLINDARRVSPTRMALLAALNSKGSAMQPNGNGSAASRLPASKILVDHSAGVRGELPNCSSFQPLDQMCANEYGREQHSKLAAQQGWPSAFSVASGDQFSQLFTADKNVNELNGALNGHVLGRPNGSSWSQEGDGIADLLTKFAGTAPSSLIEAQHLCGLEQRDTIDGELTYFTNGGHRDSASSGINLESSSASNASNGQLLFTGAHLFMNEQAHSHSHSHSQQQQMRILNADRPFLMGLNMNGNGATHDGTDSLIAQTIGFGLMRASEDAGRSDSVLM